MKMKIILIKYFKVHCPQKSNLLNPPKNTRRSEKSLTHSQATISSALFDLIIQTSHKMEFSTTIES
jgi:hypothetical protein